VCVITSAFETPARARSRVLGMEGHPLVVMKHPLASRTPEEVGSMAESFIEALARGLLDGS
jgi:hypothetical protein